MKNTPKVMGKGKETNPLTVVNFKTLTKQLRASKTEHVSHCFILGQTWSGRPALVIIRENGMEQWHIVLLVRGIDYNF